MRIKKMYQGTVPENKVVGTKTSSNTDVYSCNYINTMKANGIDITTSEAGYRTDDYGNFQHKRTTNTDEWQIKDNAGNVKFSVGFETGILKSNNQQLLVPYILYADNGGSNGKVPLSDSAANYQYMEIEYRSNDGTGYKCSSGLIYSPNNAIVGLAYNHYYAGTIYVKQAEASITGSEINLTNQTEWSISNGSTANVNTPKNVYITRVIGFK